MSARPIAVVGEALVDLVELAPGAAPIAYPGGSPFNVAIGLARLEQPTLFLGRLSGDEYGQLLRTHAADSGVDLSCAVGASEPSTRAEVRFHAGGIADYAFSIDDGADFRWRDDELARVPATFGHVHFGSLASWLSPGADVIDRYVAGARAAGGVTVSYDPNVRPGLLSDVTSARAAVHRSVGHAHVVKASSDDLRWLYPGADPADVARSWLGRGAVLVIVTDGARGATAYRADRPPLHRAGRAVPVVDTVGAGDAFTSGVLDALARYDALSPPVLDQAVDVDGVIADVLDHGNSVAAFTCTRQGAQPPTHAEISSWAGTAAHSSPT